MLRRVLPLAVVMVCLIGFFGFADEKPATSARPEFVTFTAVKTEKGELIQISAGDEKFWVPSVWFALPKKDSGDGMRVQNGRLVLSVDREGSQATMTEMSLDLHPSRTAATKPQASPVK